MNKIICVSGDSFTQEYLQNPSDRWSTQIGANYNIAMGGASNSRIFHSTIEYLLNHSPDILIVGWSSIGRGMLHTSNGERLIVTPQRCFGEETGNDNTEIHKFYYTHLQNDFVSFRDTLLYMIHLQEFCQNKNIKLLYFRSILEVELNDDSLKEIALTAFMDRSNDVLVSQGTLYNINYLKKLISKLDKNIWINEFWFSMRNFLKGTYDINRTINQPLPLNAVRVWADLVKKYL